MHPVVAIKVHPVKHVHAVVPAADIGSPPVYSSVVAPAVTVTASWKFPRAYEATPGAARD